MSDETIIHVSRLLASGTPAINISVMQWEQKIRVQKELNCRTLLDLHREMNDVGIYTRCALCEDTNCSGCPLYQINGHGPCTLPGTPFRKVLDARGPKRLLKHMEKMLAVLKQVRDEV